jgi:hypothetical protein
VVVQRSDACIRAESVARVPRSGRDLDLSIKSANETEYHLLKARDFDLVTNDIWQKFATETIDIRKLVYVYRGKCSRASKNLDEGEFAEL